MCGFCNTFLPESTSKSWKTNKHSTIGFFFMLVLRFLYQLREWRDRCFRSAFSEDRVVIWFFCAKESSRNHFWKLTFQTVFGPWSWSGEAHLIVSGSTFKCFFCTALPPHRFDLWNKWSKWTILCGRKIQHAIFVGACVIGMACRGML